MAAAEMRNKRWVAACGLGISLLRCHTGSRILITFMGARSLETIVQLASEKVGYLCW